jgi:hypothetical protein
MNAGEDAREESATPHLTSHNVPKENDGIGPSNAMNQLTDAALIEDFAVR